MVILGQHPARPVKEISIGLRNLLLRDDAGASKELAAVRVLAGTSNGKLDYFSTTVTGREIFVVLNATRRSMMPIRQVSSGWRATPTATSLF